MMTNPLNSEALNSIGGGDQVVPPQVDTLPDAFSFQDVLNVGRAELVNSNQVQITGIDTPAPVSIQNGFYSINGEAFTDESGTIEAGDYLRLQHRASEQYSAQTLTQVQVGGFSAQWRSGTLAEVITDTRPDLFTLAPAIAVARDIEVISQPVTITGISEPASIAVTDGSYSINSGEWLTEPSLISDGDSVRVKHTSSALYSRSTTSTLSIGGVSADFVSTTQAEPKIDDTPDAFTFIAQRNVPIDTEQNQPIQSNQVSISGIEKPVSIAIVSGVGEYQINNGEWLSTASTVYNADLVRVRTTASAEYATIKGVTLRVGAFSAFFSLTTEIQEGDSMADPISFNPLTNRELDAIVISNPVSITGISVNTPIFVTDGFYRINGGTWTTQAGVVRNNDTLELSHRTPATLNTVTRTKVEIGGTTEVFISVTKDGLEIETEDATALGESLKEIQDIVLDDKLESTAFVDSMAAAGIPTTPEAIEQAFRAKAKDNGVVFNNDSKFSPFWRLINTLVVQSVYWLVRFVALVVFPNSYVMTAKNKYLEYLGSFFDVQKKSDQKARGYITFYREDASQAQVIKRGSLIESLPINGITYTLATVSDGEFLAGQSEALILCEAQEAGAGHNLPAGYYRNMPKPISGVTSVNNTDTWLVTPGFNTESTENYRSRIVNAVTANSSEYFVDDVYKKIIAEFSGVSPADIFIDSDAPRGPGTANAYVLFGFGVSAGEYIDQINNHIKADGNHGLGDDIQALELPKVPQDITANVRLDQSLDPDKITPLLNEIEMFIRAAFRGNTAYRPTLAEPIKTFSFSLLAAEIHAQFPAVISIWFGNEDIKNDFNIPTVNTISVTNHV